MNWLFQLVLSFGIGAAGAWSAIKIGGSYGLMDLPGYRSSHSRPIPKGGGIGILLAFIVASLLNAVPISLWIPATIISLTGLLDDRFELSKSRRLLVHMVCALIVLIGGTHPLESFAFSPLLRIVLVSLFIAGTANFFNFMDGINGIAGISAVVGFGFLAIYSALQGVAAKLIVVDLCIVFACLGFLPFNLPRARVFMGDAGSVLIGFLFAALVWKSNTTLLGVISCAAFFFLIYADAATTFAIRFVEGDDIMVPHRRHLYQVLVNELGLPHWKVSTGYGLVQVMICVIVIVLQTVGMAAVIAGMTVMGLLFVATSVILHRKADQVPTRNSR
jgi:UDP-N-acetylmuramyl pentapeptide phosphotransferase/UDP-N-acetylglucosamine-1-phosphate transferase